MKMLSFWQRRESCQNIKSGSQSSEGDSTEHGLWSAGYRAVKIGQKRVWVMLTCSLHELGGQAQLPVCAGNRQRCDVPMDLCGLLLPATLQNLRI